MENNTNRIVRFLFEFEDESGITGVIEHNNKRSAII